MITYELAKKLKEAGYICPIRMCYLNAPHHSHSTRSGICEFLPKPTLSELMEACGDDFLSLHRTPSKSWYADTHTHDCECGKEGCKGYNWEHSDGSTPEEAVANLYLALHKNK